MIRSEDSEEAEAATGSPGPESGGRFADSADSGKDLETGTVDDALGMELVTKLITLQFASHGCEVGVETCALNWKEEGFACHCS